MLVWLLRAMALVAVWMWLARQLRRRPSPADGSAPGASMPWAQLWRRLRAAAAAAASPAPGATGPVPPSEDPWAVLGVPRGAGAAEVRAAYQREIQRYHPDQVAHLGRELQEVAERRSKAITAAYAALRGRGAKRPARAPPQGRSGGVE